MAGDTIATIMKQTTKKKIAVITCKDDPDYVRARALRNALKTFDDLEVIVIKNKSKGIRRYAEVLDGIIKVRFKQNPDAYLLTFRGYELIPLLQILAWPKPIVFDEFINLYEWTIQEHKKFEEDSLPAKMLNAWWSFILKRNKVILADTQAHAEHSSKTSRVPLEKYVAVPVGTDQALFTPAKVSKTKNKFTVFYYGNMLPLHGLEYAIRAAELLKDKPEVEFLFVGGKEEAERRVKQAQAKGAHIQYKKWVPFEDLPQVIRDAGVCLGGPFGNTVQSQFVVTGKTYQFLACGAPTIIGASEASSEFKDGTNSLIVPQGDAKALADKILWAYEHPKDLEKIAANGRKMFETNFSDEAIARSLAPVIDQIF